MSIEALDLRPLSRNADRVECVIFVKEKFQWVPWVHLGEASIQSGREGVNTIKSYMGFDATDQEEDSAYIFSINVIGLRYTSTEYGRSTFEAWIRPDDPDSFKVPAADYDPIHDADAETCDGRHCGGKPHPIVPYVPEANRTLFSTLRGREIQIHIGPVIPEESP
jgi:hypothetical protein